MSWLREGRNRMAIHVVFAVGWLAAACVVPFTRLRDSTGYVIFVVHIGLVYAAVGSAVAEWASRKADPEDPA